jgi:cyclopropane fatty-acyl-phospholipid synthase-like methyltransferase
MDSLRAGIQSGNRSAAGGPTLVYYKVSGMLGYSAACARNKDPILNELRDVLPGSHSVLEVGSGTGEHAVYFGRQLPDLIWHTSDQAEYLPGIEARVHAQGPQNVRQPVKIDVRDDPWPDLGVDAVFTANALHIMSWECVVNFFRGAGAVVGDQGLLIVYGPFRYHGEFTTASNAAFDVKLRQDDPASGIRDFEAVNELAQAQRFRLLSDKAMPANNRLLVWRRN